MDERRKERARAKLRDNVRRGTVSKPSTCSNCGKRAKQLDGHHADHRSPLKVRWLCPACHKGVH